jgi:uncharacterized coiled-coil protein SlyX
MVLTEAKDAWTNGNGSLALREVIRCITILDSRLDMLAQKVRNLEGKAYENQPKEILASSEDPLGLAEIIHNLKIIGNRLDLINQRLDNSEKELNEDQRSGA